LDQANTGLFGMWWRITNGICCSMKSWSHGNDNTDIVSRHSCIQGRRRISLELGLEIGGEIIPTNKLRSGRKEVLDEISFDSKADSTTVAARSFYHGCKLSCRRSCIMTRFIQVLFLTLVLVLLLKLVCVCQDSDSEAFTNTSSVGLPNETLEETEPGQGHVRYRFACPSLPKFPLRQPQEAVLLVVVVLWRKMAVAMKKIQNGQQAPAVRHFPCLFVIRSLGLDTPWPQFRKQLQRVKSKTGLFR
jgi:hypothetical protein